MQIPGYDNHRCRPEPATPQDERFQDGTFQGDWMRSHGKEQDFPGADKDSPLPLVSLLFPLGRRMEIAFFCIIQLQGCPGPNDWLLL